MLIQISVWLPNVPGMLKKFLDILIEHNIEVRALTVAENEEYGLLLLLVDKPRDCINLLEQEDYPVSETDVIGVRIKQKNHTKGLQELSKVLGESNINIEYLYTAVLEEDVLIVIKVNDNEKAIEILKIKGYILEEGPTL